MTGGLEQIARQSKVRRGARRMTRGVGDPQGGRQKTGHQDTTV